VVGPVVVRSNGLVGDTPVPDGLDKAVYVYFAEHYPFWRQELDQPALQYGAFGENLTVSGPDESTVHVGDLFRVGSVEIVATEPRVPCYDLNVKFDRKDFVKRCLESGHSGVYFKVKSEGRLQVGDSFELADAHPARVALQTILNLYVGKGSRADYERVVSLQALPEPWRAFFEKRGFTDQPETGVKNGRTV
jgi:MOSC domain-containing protein YiiM